MPVMREIAVDIIRHLQNAGHEAYLVGGCVRDELRKVEPQDYDIASSAHPNEVEKLFTKTVGVGKQFGVMLVIEKDHQFEVATFRSDAEYVDGRRPTSVTFSDAKADANRRDFTINGLFLDPITDTLHDWVGGQADLVAKQLRTIGKPKERFGEDHLRLLRAVRFAAQLDFEIEPETFDAAREFAEKIRAVSAERIRDELLKLFCPPHAVRGLDLLRDSGLMAHILPELLPTINCDQSPDYHPEGTVYNHIRLALEKLPTDAAATLPWAVLLHDIGKPDTASVGADGRIHFYGHEKIGAETAEAILERLRFPRKQIDEITFTVRHHMQFKDVPRMRKATLRRLLLRPTFALEREHHRIDCLASHGRLDNLEILDAEQTALDEQPALIPPLVTGHDLLALGIPGDSAMGELLEDIRDRQLAEEFTTREEALAWAKEKAAQ
tara:strand:+ start:1132 stop:2448 length:1317 start_codon:yes stop_codon:yes gene_type:complete